MERGPYPILQRMEGASRGIEAKWQIIMASINHNVKMIMGYIQNKTKPDISRGELCPQMS